MRRLSFRLLTFNILLLFLPVGGMLYLDTYERQLLEKQESAMVQEGRVFASALAGRDLEEESLRIMENLAGRMESRIRVVDSEGVLLADSAVDSSALSADSGSPYPDRGAGEKIRGRDTILYRVTVVPYNNIISALRRLLLPPVPPLGSAEFYVGAERLTGPEIAAALDGRYGAATRISSGGQRSVTLYSAIPVAAAGGDIPGAVLVSRSTWRILGDLYRIRLDMVSILLYSMAAAAAISALLSLTITSPLRRLRDRAEELLASKSDLRSSLREGFPSLKRRDEIGDLGRSLGELWRRLEERIASIDDFTSDTLHELKNPLSAIRSAAEVSAAELEGRNDADELLPFLETILDSGSRIDRLLGELREITRIDTRLEWEEVENVVPEELLEELCESFRRTAENRETVVSLRCTGSAGGQRLRMSRERLRQLLCNTLDNAFDFAVSEIILSLEYREGRGKRSRGGWIRISIGDDGPGVDPEDREKIFSRFFSAREVRGNHSGLGLSICRSIVHGYGGRMYAEQAATGGSLFIVELPAAD
jgi:two-component system sensor histidine kinase ChvG